MADRRPLGRSASTESTEYSSTMGKSVRKKSKKVKSKERWLLTRKTWRYMADAGRKLIPEGAQNRPEDIPKIEEYFQEVCKKEPKFLLWRKNSYPGAIGKKKRVPRKGGSCRKAFSENEVGALRPTHLELEPAAPGRFNLKKMKEDFLNKDSPSTSYSSHDFKMGSTEQLNVDESDESQLAHMLEQYLKIDPKAPKSFNYQELVDKLQKHLTYNPEHSRYRSTHQQVPFQGDHLQKSLLETFSRYFGQSSNRDKIVSDLLTDRKALEKLYFELRKTKGFRGSRGGTGYTTSFAYGPQRSNYELPSSSQSYEWGRLPGSSSHSSPCGPPPPLIEVQEEVTYHNWATQTMPIPEHLLIKLLDEYKKIQEEKEKEEEYGRESKPLRRRSSVDNDDISQSVSDTIKRYLRMARKKSVDTDKVDRFKRVNYDRTLRNIKAKGEITKPGDDDGLNKGCQTNEDWIAIYRDLKFADVYDVSDVESSRYSSTRSSIDVAAGDDGNRSLPSSPPAVRPGHSFLSQLLHHGKHDKQSAVKPSSPSSCSAVSTTSTTATTTTAPGAAMQKSKSSSSVMHHGGRLMAKKIFRSRSKSQTRPAHGNCTWTPQGSCVWNNVTGRQVILSDTTLLHLTEIERKVLQKVAIAKLQALNLGVAVKIPSENVSAVPAKPKRRPYLLKRKALTTGIFDTSRKESDKDKDGNTSSGGLVFGIPLTQCVENDRVSRAAAGTSPFRSTNELTGAVDVANIGRHGSRSSFSSLLDSPRNDEKGSCENVMLRSRMVGSVPGLLDTISCGSTVDLPATAAMEEECSVPNILTECFRHLEQYGLRTLGIFRVSTSKKRIRQLREDFDCGKETTLEEDQCPHDVATLLKEYLRDLPDPLLCRDLYHAFVQTQRIRNRRLQFEALQHLIQLLPSANRDTLYALLSFLAVVARNANDAQDESGEQVQGNKMDSNNLATVFAPNILHCIKPGSKESSDRPEDRIDIINVVRALIDNYKTVFQVSAELLDEVYVHMMDSHPDHLEQLLNKKDGMAGADESVDELDSESYSAPWTPTHSSGDVPLDGQLDNKDLTEQKRTYSREEFLHEAAATGGPNVGMRVRHKDRIREKSTRRRRDKNDDSSLTSSAMTIISRLRGQKDDDYQYTKNRSSSLESTSSAHTDDLPKSNVKPKDEGYDRRKSSPYVLDSSGVITASLTIPISYVDDDIPYIEDVENGRQQLTVGVVRAPSIPPRRRNHSIGSDSSVTSVQPTTQAHSYDSAVGSSTTNFSSPVHNTPNSVCSSLADPGAYSSPPSWASTPPTSPDSAHTSVNYIPDDIHIISKGKNSKEPTPAPKVSFSSDSIRRSSSAIDTTRLDREPRVNTTSRFTSRTVDKPEREPRFTPSITNIGNAVLRSKTADFERIIKVENKPQSNPDKERFLKKYTKRRYTDSRHQTRHIPDAESLEAATVQVASNDKGSQSGPVYKRREIISSVPSK